MRSILRIAAVLALGFNAGCLGVVTSDKSLARSLDDSSAATAVRVRMLRSEVDFSHINVNVSDGLVLLTGRAEDPRESVEAERIAWSAPKVRDVANEIVVSRKGRQLLGAGDAAISTQLRSRLVADGNVRGVSVNIETYQGVVYLTGRARTEAEARRVASHASLVPGVKKVVSFLNVSEDAYVRSVAGPEPETAATEEDVENQAAGRGAPIVVTDELYGGPDGS